jgi:uncharacterized protein
MSEAGRLAVFLVIVLMIWTGLHALVVWSVGRTPLVADHLSRRAVWLTAAALWLLYPLGRVLDRRGLEAIAYPLEVAGATWMGVLFLAFVAVLLAEVIRLPLGLLPAGSGRAAAMLDAAAANLPAAGFAVALLLGAIGVVQHARGPLVVAHELMLAGLPPERDGTALVAVSDLHLGSLLGRSWLGRRLAQVEALHPDAVLVVGDLIDGNAGHIERLLVDLRRLRAPLGVWAVTGNHEFYAGLDRSVQLLGEAGFRVLRNGWAEVAPGLVLAGVDDLTARRQFAPRGVRVGPYLESELDAALAGRPAGATVLLSHTPWLAERAAAAGVGLMLSGHTHGGQIWPFGYLVALQYPFVGGDYQIKEMRLVVCRGTGSWGPPLRLWRRGEIIRIVLRSPVASGRSAG